MNVSNLIWMKDTIKSKSESLVKNCEVVIVASDNELTLHSSEFPVNSECFSVRPAKKWIDEQNEVVCSFFFFFQLISLD